MNDPRTSNTTITVDVDGQSYDFPADMPMPQIQARAKQILAEKMTGPPMGAGGDLVGRASRAGLHALPSVVGGGVALGGGGLLAGPAAGLTRAMTNAIEGKAFDPTDVALETGLNMVPTAAGKILGGGKRMLNMAADAAGNSENMVGGILKPLLKILGYEAPVTAESTRVGAGALSNGSALASDAGRQAVVGASVRPDASVNWAVDRIAVALRQKTPLPADAVDTLRKAGLSTTQMNDLITRRIAGVGHGALAAEEGATRR